MQLTDISFERVHRIDRKPVPPAWGHPARPGIIVEKLAKRLKGTNDGNQEQFSEEIE